jgi:hypothetical protein
MRMAQLARDHPELVQAQLAFDNARKKTADGVGPSNAAPPPPVVPVPSDSEFELNSDFWNELYDSDFDFWNELN